MRVAVLAVMLAASSARAEPTSCRQLHAVKAGQLSAYALRRLPGAVSYEAVTAVVWKRMVVMLVVDRAPHLARAILAECPGVKVTAASPIDAKRQRSIVTLSVTSFAPLSLVAQLPAVHDISLSDPESNVEFEPLE
jgi:hypothetical protein